MRTFQVGSRKSRLALTQTGWVIDELKKRVPASSFAIRHIVTKGDKVLNVTLSKVGGKGLFVKEIEQALLSKKIDFAVHSMKDMPAELPEGLEIACVPPREDVRDAYIAKDGILLRHLPGGAVVGTSSLRRAAQLLHARPDLKVRPLRGNIDTRLKKLREGEFDAIILAAAGMKRMGWSSEVVTEYLPADLSLPAVGQGALAIECRADDEELKELLKKIHNEETFITVQAERAFLKTLNGGCQVPIAAFCRQKEGANLELTGLVAAPDGKTVLKDRLSGSDPAALGVQLAERLLEQGAGEILNAVNAENEQRQ